MPDTKKLIKDIASTLKEEQNQLKIVEEKIKKQDLDFSNKTLFHLLSKANKINKRVSFLKYQLQILTKNFRRQIIVSVGSKVQLISAKIEEVLFVDAKNYFQLVGKSIGDVVMMNNSMFFIAAVY
jgi:hypothetical protein